MPIPDGTMPCECRLCDWCGDGWVELEQHLIASHDLRGVLGDNLGMKLHAAKDYPDWSENTMGLYNPPDRLIAIIVTKKIRAADDPMRFGG